MKKESSGARATLTNTMSSGAVAGAMLVKRRAPEPELCHFHDGSTSLVVFRLYIFRRHSAVVR